MYLKALGKSLRNFSKDGCFNLAASMSFFSILSIVPLSLLIIGLFGHFLGENEGLYQFILSRLINLFPAVTNGITSELKNVITHKGISMLMIFVYGFLSLQLFYSMEHAMDAIFKVPKKRHFLISILWSILTITLVIVFLMLSFSMSSVAGLFKEYPVIILGFEISYAAGIFLKYIAPFVLVLLTFTAVYLIVPRISVSWKNAFIGALLVTVMWELAKYFFTWYVRRSIYIGAIYGSLTAFIVFLLWVYYFCCIFLFGAEFVSNLNNKKNNA
ncbi:MAG: YihY/virulence factor BrkB family protein [Nitrospirota bacterium]